jgi:hypothetical protein
MLPVEQPFKTYTGQDGKPLDGGYIYFGQPDLNPITAPVTVYWDSAGTQPACQPLRTVSGYIVNKAGAPANVFFNAAYSELVQDKHGRQVFYARTSDDFSIGSLVSNLMGGSGSSVVGYQHSTGVDATTVQAALRAELHNVNLYFIAGEADAQPMFTRALAAQKRVWVPPGTYTFNSPLPIPNNRILDGDGPDSILSFTGTGNGITSTCPINSSTAANVTLSHLAVNCTNGANTGGGFVQVGGTYVDVYKVNFDGWKYGIIYDQTEIASIRHCQITQPSFSVAGIWLPNGPDHTPGALPGYTNRITVANCQFNANPAATCNIADDGGTAHNYFANNLNAGITGIRAAGVTALVINGGNESEVHISEDIYLADTTLAGTYVGPCDAFEIAGNTLISGSGGRNIAIQNATNGRIVSNLFGQAAAAINFLGGASNQATGNIIEGNSKILSGAGITAGQFVSGFSRSLRQNLIRQVAVTYVPASASAGTVTLTPATMEFIHIGTRLHIVNQDGTNGEDTIVTATTGTTFTCTLASSKAANAKVYGATPGDQEEGTWTPTLGATVTNGTHTYSLQAGQYSRRGNAIRATGVITISAKDAAMSGALQIQGFPFISENITNGYVIGSIGHYSGFTFPAGFTHISGLISPGNLTLDLLRSGSGVAANPVQNTDVPGTTLTIYFEVTYLTSAL